MKTTLHLPPPKWGSSSTTATVTTTSSSSSSSSNRIIMMIVLQLLVLMSSTTFVLGEFDDYVDPTFNCPAQTTCKQVCVATIFDCPSEMLCTGQNELLCGDGTCIDLSIGETCDGHDESPCLYECAPIACNKVINYHNVCQELYQEYWDNETTCGELEVAYETQLFTYQESGFIFLYVWFSIIPLLIFTWCAYNQRISPVPGSCQTFELNISTSTTPGNNNNSSSTDGNNKNSSRIAWQTGYKYHPIGIVLNILTVVTMIGVYVLLSWLIIQYYIQQEAIAWSWVTGQFDDEVQVLLCFIVVWMYSLLFLFLMKFPHSVRSIHLRRCQLHEAQYVAVAVQRLEVKHTEITFKQEEHVTITSYMSKLKQYFASFYDVVHIVATFLFSDRNTFGCERKGDNTTFSFRPVQKDDNGNKFITFEFRRYNLLLLSSSSSQKESVNGISKFVPGAWSIGGKHGSSTTSRTTTTAATIGDILDLYNNTQGLTDEDVKERRRVCGNNIIEMDSKPNFLRSLKRELSTPFYTYQILMIFSWMPLWYFYMAFTWSFIVLVGSVTVSYLQYKNERNLYRLTHVSGTVGVLRDNGQQVRISQDQLVPGDIINVEPGTSYCDMVLVKASRVLVDESALTGEANPVGKVALDPLMAKHEFNEQNPNKRSTIFAGTSILEADESSRAIVLKTASYTARGDLIRDIFSYRRNLFKFDTEVPVVVTILFFYACFGWGMAYKWTGDIFVFGWFYGIYVVAGCLPPLLPTVFTVSVGISDERLAKRKVTCTNAESILVAGKVTRAFFDKTGTITKQGLDFVSARGKSSWIDESKGFSKEMSISFSTDELKLGMACCHSLTRSKTGELIGNPVDRVMFENSRAKLDDSSAPGEVQITDQTGKRVTLVREFIFDHHRMTQSVIVRDDDGNLAAFCKGSGEAIRELCQKDSLPSNFDTALRESAKSGLYQISMASKVFGKGTDITKLTRDQVECDLSFEGVINFKNVMRENAPTVIRHLEDGEITSNMLSGDSVLTCISIAKESGIIKPGKFVVVGSVEDGSLAWRDAETNASVQLPPMEKMSNIQLALSGDAWKYLQVTDPKKASSLRDYIRVVGRCTPHDKVAVVQDFARAGQVTLMCGDGGNDCGALKAAHVGVALSEAEASIVAPFTSLDKDIASVVDVVSEGRCALGSALSSYKFVILYGQILTINQLMAAYFQITFSEWGWVFMDGVWTITLAFALPLARAAKKLSPTRPTASILGLHTMSSVLGVLVLNFLFVVIAFVALNQQDFYQCRKWENTDLSNLFVIGDNYETEVLWLVTGFQVLSSAVVFNFGYEFRQAWIRNYLLVTLVVVYGAIHFYITIVPGKLSCFFRVNCQNDDVFDGVYGALSVQNEFNTTVMPESFRRLLVVLMAANLVAVVAWDYLVVNGLRRKFGAKRRSKHEANEQQDSQARIDPEALALGVKGTIQERDGESTDEEVEIAPPTAPARREASSGLNPIGKGQSREFMIHAPSARSLRSS